MHAEEGESDLEEKRGEGELIWMKRLHVEVRECERGYEDSRRCRHIPGKFFSVFFK